MDVEAVLIATCSALLTNCGASLRNSSNCRIVHRIYAGTPHRLQGPYHAAYEAGAISSRHDIDINCCLRLVHERTYT